MGLRAKRAAIGRIATAVILGGWCWCHVTFCLNFFESETSSDDYLESHLAILLAINVVVLFGALLTKEQERGSERRLGLLGGFILGVTPLGLAGIALATSLGSVKETLSSETKSVDLQRYNHEASVKIRIFVGIDTSQSMLRKDGVADQVCTVMHKMLARDPVLSSLPPALTSAGGPAPGLSKSSVFTEIWEFATDTKKIEEINSGFGSPWPEELSSKICARIGALSQGKDPSTQHTDILKFLDSIRKAAVDALSNREQVVIILLSDLLQHPEKGEEAWKVGERVREFADALKLAHQIGREAGNGKVEAEDEEVKCTRLALVALAVPPISIPESKRVARTTNGVAANKPKPVDLRPLMKSWLPDYWQDYGLQNVAKMERPDDSLLLIGALSTEIEMRVEETLYLKYSGDGRDPMITVVRNALTPKEIASSGTNYLAFKLRTSPDRGTLPSKLQVRFQVGMANGKPVRGNAGETVLNSNDGEANDWVLVKVESNRNGELQFWPASHLDVSRSARLELLLAVPARRMVYAIPIVILPTPGAKAIVVFRLIVMFFIACVVALVVTHLLGIYFEKQSQIAGNESSSLRTKIAKLAGFVEALAGSIKKFCGEQHEPEDKMAAGAESGCTGPDSL